MDYDLRRRLARAACRAKGVDPDEDLGSHPPPTSADGSVTYDVMIVRYRWHDEAAAVKAVADELLAGLRGHPYPDAEADRPHGSLMFGDDEMPGWWCSRWLDAYVRENKLGGPRSDDAPAAAVSVPPSS